MRGVISCAALMALEELGMTELFDEVYGGSAIPGFPRTELRLAVCCQRPSYHVSGRKIRAGSRRFHTVNPIFLD